MRPGITKTAALTTGYQKLATLYGAASADAIKTPDGAETANQVLVSIITQAGEVAYGPTLPVVAGHPLAAGDSLTMGNYEYIKSAWFRGVNGAVLIMTPLYE